MFLVETRFFLITYLWFYGIQGNLNSRDIIYFNSQIKVSLQEKNKKRFQVFAGTGREETERYKDIIKF